MSLKLPNVKNPEVPKDTIKESQSEQESKENIPVDQNKTTTFFSLQKHIISYFMLIVSCILWVGGFIYANQNKMSPFETTISRFSLMAFVTYMHCKLNGSPLVFINRPFQKTLFLRNIVMTFHGFVVTYMQFYLPLGIFHTLVISGQVFIFLANYFLKGVKITKNQVIGVGISFIGLIMVINGRYFYEILTKKESKFNTEFSNYSAIDIYTQIKMGFLYVLWNAMWAISVVYTKLPEYTASQILFTQSATSIIIGALGYIIFDSQSHVNLEIYLPSLFFCGVLIMVANYLFTYGIIWSVNTGISTMTFMSSAVFGYMISIFRYNEEVNMISLFGTIILSFSAGYVILEQQKVKN